MSEELKKAVTSDAAPAENGPENQAQLDGTNTPSIQEAVNPATTAKPVETQTSEVKAEEAVAAPPQQPEQVSQEPPTPKEVTFGNLFKPFSIGSTLEQRPTGNVMSNVKASKLDYVKQAQSSKNIKLTEKDFKPKK